jgi:predicted AAA+ superfamily ATPase
VITIIYKPLYMDRIMRYAGTPFVKILSSVRRCGKSTILKMIAGELRKRGVPDSRILVYNFDSMQHEDIKTARLLYEDVHGRIAADGKTYLLLDEIQEVQSWERAVNSFMVDFDVDIYVTGSNSRMLSFEISTYLTGRYISFRIFPLSFAEYMEFRKNYLTDGRLHQNEEFARYLRFGGFPAVHLREYAQDEAYSIVKDNG